MLGVDNDMHKSWEKHRLNKVNEESKIKYPQSAQLKTLANYQMSFVTFLQELLRMEPQSTSATHDIKN